MKETVLGQEFKALFGMYPIHVMVNKTQGGWPDRLIQLPSSRICFVELKIIHFVSNTFSLTNFRAEQAAFMAKWQRHNGLCFLMVMSDGEPRHYGIVTCKKWDDWLKVPRTGWRPGETTLFTKDKRDVLSWFEQYSITG